MGGRTLFAAICELPEYYPTRTEAAILRAFAEPIAEAVGERATLILDQPTFTDLLMTQSSPTPASQPAGAAMAVPKAAMSAIVDQK
mgnify:CR=1 FL=1